jgi:hypothetical protein
MPKGHEMNRKGRNGTTIMTFPHSTWGHSAKCLAPDSLVLKMCRSYVPNPGGRHSAGRDVSLGLNVNAIKVLTLSLLLEESRLFRSSRSSNSHLYRLLAPCYTVKHTRRTNNKLSRDIEVVDEQDEGNGFRSSSTATQDE